MSNFNDNAIYLGGKIGDAGLPNLISNYSYSNYDYDCLNDTSISNEPTPTLPPISPETGLTISNIFTPNNDGVNDIFQITTDSSTAFNCKIYNRWGVKIFEFSEQNSGWNGKTTNGQDCPEGVYFYVVQCKNASGNEETKKGYIQLVR